MHSEDEIDDDDIPDAEACDFTLFDISDVTYHTGVTKSGKEFTLVLRAKDRFNAMKTYLALEYYLAEVKSQLGILEGDDSSH